MLTTILTREEAAEARRAAADQYAAEQHKREGGGVPLWRSRTLETMPRDLGQQRFVDFKANHFRAVPDRRNGMDMVHLQGHASVVDTPYEMWDFFGPFDEIMHREAFDKTLAAGPDVAFVVNHTGLTMARTIQPAPDKVPTLELAMGQIGEHYGLVADAWVNPDPLKRPDVAMLLSAVEEHLITEMSFKFMLVQGRWSDDFTQYTITEVDIDRGDVSAVNYGANPHTTIAARSREWMAMAERMPRGAQIAMQERLSQQINVIDFYERRRMAQEITRAVEPTAGGRSLAEIERMLQS